MEGAPVLPSAAQELGYFPTLMELAIDLPTTTRSAQVDVTEFAVSTLT